MKRIVLLIGLLLLSGCATMDKKMAKGILDIAHVSKVALQRQATEMETQQQQLNSQGRIIQQYQATLNELFACQNMDEVDRVFTSRGMARPQPVEVGPPVTKDLKELKDDGADIHTD